MKNRTSSVRVGLCAYLSGLLLLTLTPLTAVAFDPPPPGAGLCFGFGFGANPYFADVLDGVAGNELITTNISELVYADSDADGFRGIRATVTVKLYDRSGTLQWSSAQLKSFSPDVATVIDGGGLFPDTYILPGLQSTSFDAILFLGGVTCYGTAYAVEAAGQKYLAVMVGFLTQTGNDEASGVDESRADVWILNRNTGAVVFKHSIRKLPGRFLAGISISGIGDVDSDSDDELVVAWAQPFGNGAYKILYKTYNVLTGVQEETFSFFTSNVRTFQ